MVRELERERQKSDFPETAPAANPVFFRTYSRRTETGRETWDEVCDRTTEGFTKLGKLTSSEAALIHRMMRQIKSLPLVAGCGLVGQSGLKSQRTSQEPTIAPAPMH
jgi:ribonucleotide reductase class II